MHPDDEVMLDAANIIAAESALATLQKAITATLAPMLAETFRNIGARLDDLDKRVARLEGKP